MYLIATLLCFLTHSKQILLTNYITFSHFLRRISRTFHSIFNVCSECMIVTLGHMNSIQSTLLDVRQKVFDLCKSWACLFAESVGLSVDMTTLILFSCFCAISIRVHSSSGEFLIRRRITQMIE